MVDALSPSFVMGLELFFDLGLAFLVKAAIIEFTFDRKLFRYDLNLIQSSTGKASSL